ncbi:MAG: hypothetical protein C0193_01075 [Candidatus Bathyarchaeota archaeon]|nr:MAG: hypothetical protein C0193_01075 [Candidatus Bathyarchaeota archaeon]
MTLQDLETAKRRLKEGNLTLSIVKNGKVLFETVSHGVSGFLEAIEKCGSSLERASAADRIVGKAIALLCVYARIKAVYAVTLSKKAKVVLEENSIYHRWENLVENILGVDGKSVCPFEKLADEIPNPKEAYKKLRALQQSLKREQQKKTRTVYIKEATKRKAENS